MCRWLSVFPRTHVRKVHGNNIKSRCQYKNLTKNNQFPLINLLVKCDGCERTCGDDEQLCYVIDNNGYIIISEQNITDTGRFFGELEKAVMESMLYANIFKKVTVYDLQALCKNVTEIRDPDDQSASPGLLSVRYLY